jgi:aspartate/methionine/tyrosine aminotransferase
MLTREHKLSADFWETRELLVTTGSLDGVCRVFDMTLEEGDPVLYAEPSFSGVADAVRRILVIKFT